MKTPRRTGMTEVSVAFLFSMGLVIGFLAGCLITTWVKNGGATSWWTK